MRNKKEIDIRKQDIDKRIKKHCYGEKLYHYTSLTSLIGIIKNKELWLGNTANMNDKSEIIDFIKKLRKAVREDIYSEKIDECNKFFKKLNSRLKNEYPFAICLSRLNDNAAQWERYADNAKGVCIVFNTSLFMNLFYYSGALFNEVFYEYDIKEHKQYQILKDYFNNGVLHGLNNEVDIMDNLLACAYMHKHESFYTEEEVRLTNLWNRNIKDSEISFEMVNGKIKKVLKVSLNDLCADEGIDFEKLFDRIIIAPRSEQNKQELKEYIKSLGCKKLSNKVMKSQCPLR